MPTKFIALLLIGLTPKPKFCRWNEANHECFSLWQILVFIIFVCGNSPYNGPDTCNGMGKICRTLVCLVSAPCFCLWIRPRTIDSPFFIRLPPELLPVSGPLQLWCDLSKTGWTDYINRSLLVIPCNTTLNILGFYPGCSSQLTQSWKRVIVQGGGGIRTYNHNHWLGDDLDHSIIYKFLYVEYVWMRLS